MKKNFLPKRFKTKEQMDKVLEESDLSQLFLERGVVKRPSIKKINLDLPQGIIDQIDRCAEQIGVSRQPLLKIWIHERLKAELSGLQKI